MLRKSLLIVICCLLWCLPGAHARAAWYVAAINPDGSSGALTASSGILPGTNPNAAISVRSPLRASGDDFPMALWQERKFPKIDPGSLRQTKQFLADRRASKAAPGMQAYAQGQQKSFWVKDDNDFAWRQVEATCKKESAHGYVFVDDSFPVPDSSIALYAEEFDVIYEEMQGNMGVFADRDGNGKVSILLYAMNDSGTTAGYIAGYFWDKDYLDAAADSHSNEMDIIYIRGNQPGGWDTVESTYGNFYTFNIATLAHEYAHMVQFSMISWNTGSGSTADVWIDEMMALAAETMYFKEKLRTAPGFTHPDMLPGGYLASRIKYYTQDAGYAIRNGHGLTNWEYSGQTLANYSLSYLMGQYLSVHALRGQKIFKDILDYMLAHDTFDYQAVGAVAVWQLPGTCSWDDLLKHWAAANLLNKPSGHAGYKNAFELKAHGPTANPAHINNGGIVYRKVLTLAIPADAEPPLIFYFFDDNGLPLRGKKTWDSCAAKNLLGSDHSGLACLYTLRDRVLGRTETGIRLAALYYRHTAEVSLLLEKYPALRAHMLHLLVDMLPLARKLATATIPAVPQALLTECAAGLDALGTLGSPELQQALSTVQEGLANGSTPRELGIVITDTSHTTMQKIENHD